MPRPPIKRRQQNSFSVKSPKRRRVQVPDQSQARQQHEKNLLQKPVGKRPDNSDDSEDIVTTATTGRNRKRQEIFASGAVAKGDKLGAYPTRAQRTRTIREHTEEILSQRSRSTSRANSVGSAKSTPTAQSASEREDEPTKGSSKADGSTSAKRTKLSVESTTVNGVSHTPHAEVSILGGIKPRKRQASILQLIENDNNDSTINTDDEAEFLPEESSPLVDQGHSARSPPEITGLSSLKRKRGSDQSESVINVRASSSSPAATAASQPVSNPFRLPQEQIPQPTRAQQKVLNRKQKDQDDVMAPPESSDDESANERPAQAPPSNSKKQRRPVAPSTEQLQDLMPSKKLKSRIRRQQQDEFDIPDDSGTSEASEDENDLSTFLPSKGRKTSNKGKTIRPPKSQTRNSAKAKGKVKETQKSTRNTSYTPSPVRLRTPHPLSSMKTGIQAKSPSKQDTTLREKPANTPLAVKIVKGGKTKKQYGGFHLRGAGKENQVVSLDAQLGGETEALGSPSKTKKTEQATTAEVRAWKKKWGDIDDFALEFEENTASTRSSSPTAR